MVHYKIFDVILYHKLTGKSRKECENWASARGILPARKGGQIFTDLNYYWGTDIQLEIEMGRNGYEIPNIENIISSVEVNIPDEVRNWIISEWKDIPDGVKRWLISELGGGPEVLKSWLLSNWETISDVVKRWVIGDKEIEPEEVYTFLLQNWNLLSDELKEWIWDNLPIEIKNWVTQNMPEEYRNFVTYNKLPENIKDWLHNNIPTLFRVGLKIDVAKWHRQFNTDYGFVCENLHNYIDDVIVLERNRDGRPTLVKLQLKEDYILYLFTATYLHRGDKLQYIFIGRRGTGKTTLAKRFCEFGGSGDDQTQRKLCRMNWAQLPSTTSAVTWKFEINSTDVIIEDTMGYTSSLLAEQQIGAAMNSNNGAKELIVIFVWAVEENGEINTYNVLESTVKASTSALNGAIDNVDAEIYQHKVFFILNKGDLLKGDANEIISDYEKIVKSAFNGSSHLTPEFIWWEDNSEKKPFALHPPDPNSATPEEYIKKVFFDEFVKCNAEEVLGVLSQGFEKFIKWIKKVGSGCECDTIRTLWGNIYTHHRYNKVSTRDALDILVMLSYYILLKMLVNESILPDPNKSWVGNATCDYEKARRGALELQDKINTGHVEGLISLTRANEDQRSLLEELKGVLKKEATASEKTIIVRFFIKGLENILKRC